MLKLTDLEFSETLKLDKTSYLKGGSQLDIYNSDIDVSSDEISIETDIIDINIDIDKDLDLDLEYSNDIDSPLNDFFYYDWSFYYYMNVEADIAVVPNS